MEINELLKQMTFEEKAALLTGSGTMFTADCKRLGVPMKHLADGPHGVRNYEPGTNCTTLPSMCAAGATWSRDAAYKMGQTIARDCIHQHVQMILGPGLNIKRDALNGRNFEYVSEDPVLTGEIAGAYVKGCEELGVATSMKHFALNSQETNRTENSAEVDERTMREIYLRGFEIAMHIGNPTSIMCAYNKINSIWCSENKCLLTEILKGDWGYEGLVVSDWGAVHDEAKALAAGLALKKPLLPPSVDAGGHGGSHGYLSNDFIEAILLDRPTRVGVLDALNMTVPGYYAHLSAVKNGETLKVPQYSLD